MKINSSYIQLDKLSVTESYNNKDCFESRDKHFMCMDKSENKMDHSYCKETYFNWKNSCTGSLRKHQMMNRFLNLRNKRLYTEEEINLINKGGKA